MSKRSWVVRVHCKVIKDLICEDCTEEQAEHDPFEHCVDEQEMEQFDWEVVSVKENV